MATGSWTSAGFGFAAIASWSPVIASRSPFAFATIEAFEYLAGFQRTSRRFRCTLRFTVAPSIRIWYSQNHPFTYLMAPPEDWLDALSWSGIASSGQYTLNTFCYLEGLWIHSSMFFQKNFCFGFLSFWKSWTWANCHRVWYLRSCCCSAFAFGLKTLLCSLRSSKRSSGAVAHRREAQFRYAVVRTHSWRCHPCEGDWWTASDGCRSNLGFHSVAGWVASIEIENRDSYSWSELPCTSWSITIEQWSSRYHQDWRWPDCCLNQEERTTNWCRLWFQVLELVCSQNLFILTRWLIFYFRGIFARTYWILLSRSIWFCP